MFELVEHPPHLAPRQHQLLEELPEFGDRPACREALGTRRAPDVSSPPKRRHSGLRIRLSSRFNRSAITQGYEHTRAAATQASVGSLARRGGSGSPLGPPPRRLRLRRVGGICARGRGTRRDTRRHKLSSVVVRQRQANRLLDGQVGTYPQVSRPRLALEQEVSPRKVLHPQGVELAAATTGISPGRPLSQTATSR
jgi:hypothetical protein